MQNARSQNLLLFHFVVVLFGFTSVLGALISLKALPLVIYRMGIASLGLAVFFLIFYSFAISIYGLLFFTPYTLLPLCVYYTKCIY